MTARVEITMGGRVYPIVCGVGEEDRVREIARYVDRRLTELKRQAVSATDMHLMVMLALLLADELLDARSATSEAPSDGVLAESVARLADRVEAIAAWVEQS